MPECARPSAPSTYSEATGKESLVMGTQWSKEFMTVKEVATQLHLSRATVYRMIKDGILAYVTIGAGRGRIRVPRDEVRHYIDSLKAEARRNIPTSA